MENAVVAQIAAVVGAGGAAAVITARGRILLGVGALVLVVAGGLLTYSLVPADDLVRLVNSPLRGAACVVGIAAILALAAALARYPALVPVALLAAAPVRIPVEIGSQEAFLLVPLYGVLAAGALALAYRATRGAELRTLPAWLSVPIAIFVSLTAVSLLWSQDVRSGSIELLFFVFPFAGLLAIVVRSPLAEWLPRALAGGLVVLACIFAAVGLSQLKTENLYFAHDLEVANAYTAFFRTTSLFRDSSVYGRQLVFALAVLVVALWLGKVRLWLALPPLALICAGLYYTYSQSSFVTLFVVVLFVTLVAADRRSRLAVAAVAAAIVVTAGVAFVVRAQDESLQRLTSGRWPLVELTTDVFASHPLVGVGVGGQAAASSERPEARPDRDRNVSHTTPLTVAAELGAVGLLAYVGFLAAAGLALLQASARNHHFGLGLAAVFVVLLTHSLFYSGFFQDPLTWGTIALAGALAVETSAVPVLGRWLERPRTGVRAPAGSKAGSRAS